MAKAKLSYEKDFYQPVNIRNYIKNNGAADIRKEYTRLRDIAQKRLKRMQGTMWTETQTYLKNVNHYPTLKNIQSDADLAKRLSDLSRFISAKTGSVSGLESQMKKSLATLSENGYTFVTRSNFIPFGQFMEEYRFQKLDEIYDSGDAADTYNLLERHRIDPSKVKEDFEFWLANREVLSQLPEGRGKQIKESTLKKRLTNYAKKNKLELQDPGTLNTKETKGKKSKKGR